MLLTSDVEDQVHRNIIKGREDYIGGRVSLKRESIEISGNKTVLTRRVLISGTYSGN